MKKVGCFQVMWSGFKLNWLQVAWNFERLQNIGFLFSIYNVLKRIYAGNRGGMLRAIKRHLGFFNTHIFFSSAVLGAIIRLEQDISEDNPAQKESEIETTKMSIMGPMAAIGDSLFWSGIKPFALLCGAGILYIGGYSVKMWLIGAVTALLVYNIPRVAIKYYLLIKSFYDFEGFFALVQKIKFQDIMKSIKIVGMGILGGVVAGFLVKKELAFDIHRVVDNVFFLAAFSLFAILLKRKVSISSIFASIVVVSILFSYI